MQAAPRFRGPPASPPSRSIPPDLRSSSLIRSSISPVDQPQGVRCHPGRRQRRNGRLRLRPGAEVRGRRSHLHHKPSSVPIRALQAPHHRPPPQRSLPRPRLRCPRPLQVRRPKPARRSHACLQVRPPPFCTLSVSLRPLPPLCCMLPSPL